MIILRYLLLPFAIIYDFITAIRNYCYDSKIFKSYSFDTPIIVVGNLSVGGTGKTPHVEYLIRLLTKKYSVATLSRGYKRNTKGFILADEDSDAKTIGDEPFQLYNKFKNINVAVDEDRKNGIEELLKLSDKPEVILLDDAYQHRRVKAGFYVLLTSFDKIITDDYLMPTGSLRENTSNSDRADIIVVTKCPLDLPVVEQESIKEKISKYYHQYIPILFATIAYDEYIYSKKDSKKVSDIIDSEKVLIAGIAKPKPFFDHLKSENNLILKFPNHHYFSEKELLDIKKKSNNKLIITTEKDYMRLKDSVLSDQLYYLPVRTVFLKYGNVFDKFISDYMFESTLKD